MASITATKGVWDLPSESEEELPTMEEMLANEKRKRAKAPAKTLVKASAKGNGAGTTKRTSPRTSPKTAAVIKETKTTKARVSKPRAKTSTPRTTKKTSPPPSTSKFFNNAPVTKAIGTTGKAPKKAPPAESATPGSKAREVIVLDGDTPPKASTKAALKAPPKARAKAPPKTKPKALPETPNGPAPKAPARRRSWTPVRDTAPAEEDEQGNTTPLSITSNRSISSVEKRNADSVGLNKFRYSSEEAIAPVALPADVENMPPKKRKIGTANVAPKEKKEKAPRKAKAPPKPRAPKGPKAPKKAPTTFVNLWENAKDIGPFQGKEPEEAQSEVKKQMWTFDTSSQLMKSTQEREADNAVDKDLDTVPVASKDGEETAPVKKSLWDFGASQLEDGQDGSQWNVIEDNGEDLLDDQSEAFVTAPNSADNSIIIPSSPADEARRNSWSGTSVSSPDKVPDSPVANSPSFDHEPAGAYIDFDNEIPPLGPPSPSEGVIAESFHLSPQLAGIVSNFTDLTDSPALPTIKHSTSTFTSATRHSTGKPVNSLFISSDDDDFPTSYQPRSPTPPRETKAVSAPMPNKPSRFDFSDDDALRRSLSPLNFNTFTHTTFTSTTTTAKYTNGAFDSTDDENSPPRATLVSSPKPTARPSVLDKLLNLSSSPPASPTLGARPFSTSSVAEAAKVTKSKTTARKVTTTTTSKATASIAAEEPVKRKPGRPRKSEESVVLDSDVEEAPKTVKRGPGRPKKKDMDAGEPEGDEPKAPVKRKVGRPKKTNTVGSGSEGEEIVVPAKKGPGRQKKSAATAEVSAPAPVTEKAPKPAKGTVRKKAEEETIIDPDDGRNYTAMTTPELIKIVDGYGMKYSKSRKALLQMIADSIARRIAHKEEMAAKNAALAASPAKPPPSPHRRSRSRSPSEIAALTASATADSIPPTFLKSLDADELQTAITNAIKKSPFWTLILCYQPVVIQEVQAWLNGKEGGKLLGVELPLEAVRAWADGRGVCFRQEEGSGWGRRR